MTALLAITLLAAAPAGSLDESTRAVATTLRPLEAPIGLFVTGPKPLADAYASLLASLLADAKQSPVVLSASLGDSAERAARDAGLRSLVRLEASCDGAALVVRGDAFSTWQNFWSGKLPSRSSGAVVIAERTVADEAVRTLAGSVALTPQPLAADAGLVETDAGVLTLELVSLAALPRRPAALATGDLEQDGRVELAVLFDDAVWLFDASGKLKAQAALVAPKSPTPTREPFGLVVFQGDRLLVWSGRRAQPEAFAWSGGALTSRSLVEPTALPVSLTPALAAFEPSLRLWGRTYELPRGAQSLSALEGAALVTTTDGSARFVRAQGVGGGTLGAVGCGSALANFGAGQPTSVVATSTRARGDGDVVRVLPLLEAEGAAARGASSLELKASWQGALTRGRAVLASAGEDATVGGFVVLGVWHDNGSGELVLLRRGTP